MMEGLIIRLFNKKSERSKKVYKYMEILDAGTITHAKMEKELKSSTSGEQENHSKPNYVVETSSNGHENVHLLKFSLVLFFNPFSIFVCLIVPSSNIPKYL